ncbi:TetR family transcriptional regulator [Rhodococcus sp. RS1C4]|nr:MULTISPECIES: helix-turn-helix domain-containing protein [unclassified Rhodococcus (in: high G+C Gram-positive bacteria)]OZC48533.1 TetR family transcriptional regulator [Rhodococcus sp. RS1C4]OZF01066.1 TetR family transcriptional regulator [Rhodococcus sp. 15-1154-1]
MTRADRNLDTREALLATAERLYAEEGIHPVSNRHVSEAAGQGNNAAVAYHFGTKTDLVRAILEKHSRSIEEIRSQMVARVEGSDDLQDWVACLIRPYVSHLDSLGSPSWYGRFSVQLISDPVLRSVAYARAGELTALKPTLAGLERCLPELPVSVRKIRGDMARNLMMHTCADNEMEFAENPDVPPNWTDCGTDLIDATVGIWRAPVSRS